MGSVLRVLNALYKIERSIERSRRAARRNGDSKLPPKLLERADRITGFLEANRRKIFWLYKHQYKIEDEVVDPIKGRIVHFGKDVQKRISKSVERLENSEFLWPKGVIEKAKIEFGDERIKTLAGLSNSSLYIVIDTSAILAKNRFQVEDLTYILYSNDSPQVAVVLGNNKAWLHISFGGEEIRYYRLGFNSKKTAYKWEEMLSRKGFRQYKGSLYASLENDEYESLYNYIFNGSNVGPECLDIFDEEYFFCEECGGFIDYDEDVFCRMCGHPVSDERKKAAQKVSNEGFLKFALIKAGFYYLKAGDYDVAREFFDGALELDVRVGEAYLGNYLAGEKISCLAKLIEKDKPFNKDCLYETATRYVRTQTLTQLKDIEFKRDERERWEKLTSDCQFLIKEIHAFDMIAHEAKDRAEEQELAQKWETYRSRAESFKELDISYDIIQLCESRLAESLARVSVLPKRSLLKSAKCAIQNMFKG